MFESFMKGVVYVFFSSPYPVSYPLSPFRSYDILQSQIHSIDIRDGLVGVARGVPLHLLPASGGL